MQGEDEAMVKGAEASLEELEMGTKKKSNRFSIEMVLGENGLGKLLSECERMPLQGKDHEFSDFDMLAQLVQDWGQNLHGKLEFNELLGRIEKMGSKTDFQTFLRDSREVSQHVREHYKPCTDEDGDEELDQETISFDQLHAQIPEDEARFEAEMEDVPMDFDELFPDNE